ncbi:GNAT family N-acetyltransferase [Planococcus sp. YIM B11945]|uniref:GNAT family N-acetyltransferase n=1 Tax=Planococcus sp. YIM B11945 TaxID=3435410 RepID=UPI003D7C412D
MIFRQAKTSEFEAIYRMGYEEWPKGRSLAQYIEDNQKEEAVGTRFVLANRNDEAVASLMLLRFQPYLFGIGSVVVAPAFRSQGLGKQLIEGCVRLYPDAAFMLYSEIGTAYYERFGFKALPEEFQQSRKGICMLKADGHLYEAMLKEPLPAYF